MTRRVTVVGAGALGSHLVLFLRNLDVDLWVIDFDRVARKNVLAQFHGTKSVGKAKVRSLQQTMQALFGMRVSGVPQRLRADNVAQFLQHSDLVVACLGNLESRTLVSEFVRAYGLPCLHGALAPGGQFGRVVWDEHFVADSEAESDTETCASGEFLPFIGMVSSFLAYATQVFLASGKKLGFHVHPDGITPI